MGKLLNISGQPTVSREEQLEAELQKAKLGTGAEVGAQFRKDLAEKLIKENEGKIKAEVEKHFGPNEFFGYAAQTMEMWLTHFSPGYSMALLITKADKGNEKGADILLRAGSDNNFDAKAIKEAVERVIAFDTAKKVQDKVS